MTSHLAQTLDNDAYQLAQLRHYSLRRVSLSRLKIFAPLMTISINSVIHLIGKVVILEVIFSMSGIGKLLINAINQRDYPLIQGIVVFIIVLIMFINYLGDIIILNNEPRLRRRHTNAKPMRKEVCRDEKYQTYIAISAILSVMFVLIVYCFMQDTKLGSTQSPNSQHWLGTDRLGRDFLVRLIVGSLVTLSN